ncbi:MAG TPA: hypothetical protein PLF91_06555, partial [Mycolicibacterium fallax]|nr:hypothetical protein [Mycolicibacterium fallax]
MVRQIAAPLLSGCLQREDRQRDLQGCAGVVGVVVGGGIAARADRPDTAVGRRRVSRLENMPLSGEYEP